MLIEMGAYSLDNHKPYNKIMGSEPPCVDICSRSHLLSFTSESF
jgi:hypothetical protein